MHSSSCARGAVARRTGVVGALAAAALAAWPTLAFAQLLRISPGPLAEPHSGLDGVTQCFNCHPTRGGKGDVSCFGCHQHRDLKAAIDAGKGLHAKLRRPCLQCHTEHKGREAEIAKWSEVGGRQGFHHHLTGYSTKGIHERVACVACHKKRTPKGRIKYTGVSTSCAGCHPKVHQGTRAEIKDKCELCHVPDGVPTQKLRLADVPFDHAKQGGLALAGNHRKPTCSKCHERGRMVTPPTPRTCVNCHKSPHGANYAKLKCTDCHDPVRRYKEVSFDHKTTQFQLAGKHRIVGCAKCHKSKTKKPERECESCHKDLHRKRFTPLKCAQCHQNGSPQPTLFNHARRTRFALTAKHAQVRCRACHPGKAKPFEFQRRTDVVLPDPGHIEINCRKCHQKAHGTQFGEKKCLDCHKESGSKKLSFDHARDSKFALTGLHLTTKCAKCHTKDAYRHGKVACASCHEDKHKGQLGPRCERCHPTDSKFKATRVDHSRVSTYPLEGLHQKVECAKCHPDKKYKIGRPSCADCHRAKDPHRGRLGAACERCHAVAKRAPKFVHDAMTKFPLTGGHVAVGCEFCHRPPAPTGPRRAGWTRGLPRTPVDNLYPVSGKRCAECHHDQHAGRYGLACEGCHRGKTFREVTATVHDTGAFRLEGIHATLPCGRCHEPQRQLWGLGSLCQTCHRRDDPHGNALGAQCGDCHGQVRWRPAHFAHTQTGFALRGAHRTAKCQACHGTGTFAGRPTDCELCHQRDASRVRDPVHSAELRPCDRCHSELGFVPARLAHTTFPLVGQHRLVRCRNCHRAGAYAGTPNTCDACHLSLYLAPRTKPDHRAAGYSTSCEDCHTPLGWRPARRRR